MNGEVEVAVANKYTYIYSVVYIDQSNIYYKQKFEAPTGPCDGGYMLWTCVKSRNLFMGIPRRTARFLASRNLAPTRTGTSAWVVDEQFRVGTRTTTTSSHAKSTDYWSSISVHQTALADTPPRPLEADLMTPVASRSVPPPAEPVIISVLAAPCPLAATGSSDTATAFSCVSL